MIHDTSRHLTTVTSQFYFQIKKENLDFMWVKEDVIIIAEEHKKAQNTKVLLQVTAWNAPFVHLRSSISVTSVATSNLLSPPAVILSHYIGPIYVVNFIIFTRLQPTASEDFQKVILMVLSGRGEMLKHLFMNVHMIKLKKQLKVKVQAKRE